MVKKETSLLLKLSFLLSFACSNMFIIATKQPTQTSKTEFEKFSEKFAPPVDVKDVLNNVKEYGLFLNGRIPDTDFYYKGSDIQRIKYAYLLEQRIKKLNVGDHLQIPKKYFHDGRVIAEAIEPDYDNRDYYTYDEVEALKQLQEDVCYMDLKPQNILRNIENGKLAIIDTEARSFAGGRHFKSTSKQQCLEQLYLFVRDHTDSKSRAMLLERIHELEKNEDRNQKINFLKEMEQFNHSGINFETADKEFSEELKKTFYKRRSHP